MNDALMSVGEMIEAVVGPENKACTVNFRMLKTVLLILANQLRISDRQVQITASRRELVPTESELAVIEVMIEADSQKKRKTSSRSASIIKSAKDDPEARIPEADMVCRSAPHLPVDIMEEQRERELRIIDQVPSPISGFVVVLSPFKKKKRANSLEEPARSPTPMASVGSLSREKLLLVGAPGHAPRLSLVTKEEFNKLSRTVRKLQAKYEPMGTQGFPENAELMQALRKGASLTDAMAAFHLSSRLDAFEKAFGIVFSLLTELAKNTPGVDMSEIKAVAKEVSFIKGQVDAIPEKQVESVMKLKYIPPSAAHFEEHEDRDYVTLHELEVAMGELYDDVVDKVRHITNNTRSESDNAKRTISDLAQKLSASLDVMERFESLEVTVAECAKKLDDIVTGLSSQISNYQDEMAQIQNELDTGLHSVEQTLANMSHDPDAIADLNKNLKAVREDIENLGTRHKEIRDFQHKMAIDLAGLWQQIELIRDTKADRDEVSDALRDKASIRDLNEMVALQYFDAVRGDLQSKILDSYEKFNNQEAVWQKIIDDVISRLNDKGDWVQLCDLRDDMSRHLTVLRDKVNALAELVGEPQAAAISKELFRDAACLSCRKHARMQLDPEKLPLLPALKRQSADGAEAAGPKEDGNHGVCYVGRPIPHPRDPRSHMCNRYCGGSHTLLPSISRAPRAMTITALPREVSETVGADGKVYQTDELKVIKPCVACNIPKATPHPTEGDIAPEPPAQILASCMSGMMIGMDWLPPKYRTGSYTPPFTSMND